MPADSFSMPPPPTVAALLLSVELVIASVPLLSAPPPLALAIAAGLVAVEGRVQDRHRAGVGDAATLAGCGVAGNRALVERHRSAIGDTGTDCRAVAG